MRIAFLHPDLGIGGAERLVVDAAAGLAALGHDVTMFTSHYDPARCFEETKDGSFGVRVHGDWLPRHVRHRLHIVFATLRNLWLALCVALRRDRFDVLICDQVSACVPLLRLLCPRSRVLFYCHFPDQLLVQSKSLLSRAYRLPFNLLEETTTGLAHHVLVNSEFTRATFTSTFSLIRTFLPLRPTVLYPCIQVGPDDQYAVVPPRARTVFLSINRFERKKSIDLALHALAALRGCVTSRQFEGVQLVVAGGYDVRVAENVEYYETLVQLAQTLGLNRPAGSAAAAPPSGSSHSTASSSGSGDSSSIAAPQRDHVTFVRSFTDAQKRGLLEECTAVVYTPSHEHFGIVPLETMAALRPVIAANSGGPLETVVHERTGFLCEPTPQAFAAAMARFVADPSLSGTLGTHGRERVQQRFSRGAFAGSLEGTCAGLVRGSGGSGGGWRAWALFLGFLLCVVALRLSLLWVVWGVFTLLRGLGA